VLPDLSENRTGAPRIIANIVNKPLTLHIKLCNIECKRGYNMATNLALDDTLIIEAQKIGGHKTKKEAVTEALQEYIQRRKQLEIKDLFGKIVYNKDYNHKDGRS